MTLAYSLGKQMAKQASGLDVIKGIARALASLGMGAEHGANIGSVYGARTARNLLSKTKYTNSPFAKGTARSVGATLGAIPGIAVGAARGAGKAYKDPKWRKAAVKKLEGENLPQTRYLDSPPVAFGNIVGSATLPAITLARLLTKQTERVLQPDTVE